MALDNVAFGAPYLLDNSNTSFPVYGVPAFAVNTDDNSEFQAICGFSLQGRSLIDSDMGTMLKAKIKKFGSSYMGPLPIIEEVPSVIADEGTYRKGFVRFVLCDESGVDFLDTNDILNTTDCDSSGNPVTLEETTGFRKEEIIRGDFIHGFVQKDGYFLTYIIHYPTFYEFFGASGYYGSGFGSPPVADYSTNGVGGVDQLSLTSLAPNAISPEAKSVQSLCAVDIYEDPAYWYENKPIFTSDDDTAISNSLRILHNNKDEFQKIIFNRNDPAGYNRLNNDYTPCYITQPISGETNNPWVIDDAFLGSGDINLSSDYKGDVFFREGFNVDMVTSSPAIAFNAIACAGYGCGPECEDSTDKPSGAVRKLNSVTPDEIGNIFIGADKCLMVGPVINSSSSDYRPVEIDQSDTGVSWIKSLRMFNGHPGSYGGTNTLTNRGGGSPGLIINGFCSECCSCENYEKLFNALTNIAKPVWIMENEVSQDNEPGLVSKTEKVRDGYQCLVDQYNLMVECFEDDPVRVTTAAWGNYGYLVNAQVLIQNHGDEDLTGNVTIKFDFGTDNTVEYVVNTSYASIDEANVDSTDFNPAQPLESMPNSNDNVDIQSAGDTITLSGGFLNLGTPGIRRGRYMFIGVLAYLKDSAFGDLCSPTTLQKTLTTTVTGINQANSLVDTNQYECLSTLFLATPCTPPIASAIWVVGDKLYAKVTGANDSTNPMDGQSMSVKITALTDWIDWIPALPDGTSDQCGNTIQYGFPPSGENSTSINISLSFTGNVAGPVTVPGVAPTTAGLWSTTNVPQTLDIFCTCEDCGDQDDDGDIGSCQDCTYYYFPKRVKYTLELETAFSVPCPGAPIEADDLVIEPFEITTPVPATVNPSILYYHCDTPASGSGDGCFTPG